ncbi:amidohydrolase family protein [Vibrio alginolyticus]|nr:amidohydrolase family protein [Vibrio alginolyticus]ELB2736559.1 amidohydrolase family protein [Vibrio alginolyticus]ELB2758674.1 amidohydrolase family protein [Vibrio alginolyticus]MCR9597470.1 amidohydrolase family protein [Vibrio alginolyticus]MCR9601978.1 amidohydrolase family protein [Vibrio alginolyticus]
MMPSIKKTLPLLFLAPYLASAAPILIKDATLVVSMNPTESDTTGRLYDKDILINNGKIQAIGSNLSTQGKKVINASGLIVMPGFVDVHDHIWQTNIRGCKIDKTVNDWLPPCVFPVKFTYQQAYDAVQLGTLDLINTGVTTVNDWSHSYSDEWAEGNLKALQDSGLRYVFTYNLQKDKNSQARKLKGAVDKDPQGAFHLASHPALWWQESLKNAVDLAESLNTTLDLHYAENVKDRLDGQTEAIKNTGANKIPLILDHVVDVNNYEIQMMAEAKSRVSYNALSNMRLASGIAPMGKINEAGIPIGLGLDGGASDNANYFTLMRVAVGLQRVKHQSPKAFPTIEDVLYLATLGGAKVLGLDDKIGSLEVGKQADIIIIDPDTTNMGVNFDNLAQIPFNAEPVNVKHVMVNGKLLKENGKLKISDKDFSELLERNRNTVKELINTSEASL